MPDLDRLREEHANLMAIGRRLSAIITQDAPPPMREFYALRMEFASTLIHHLKTEDWLLYPELLASGNERVALTSRAFSAEMGGLAKAFGDHTTKWGAHAIECDWQGYRRATAEILRLLTLRVTREERDLYPLLETGGSRLSSISLNLSASSQSPSPDTPRFVATP